MVCLDVKIGRVVRFIAVFIVIHVAFPRDDPFDVPISIMPTLSLVPICNDFGINLGDRCYRMF